MEILPYLLNVRKLAVYAEELAQLIKDQII